MSFYSLTHLTGRKKNVDRKIIVATVEANKSTFIVVVVSVVASLIPTSVAVAIFGMTAAVIVPPLFIIAGYFLIRYRSQKGLQMPMYKLLLDRKASRALSRQVLVCGVPIPDHSNLGHILPSSVPVKRTDPGVEDLFVAPGKGSKKQRNSMTPAMGRETKTTAPAARSELFD